MTIAFCLFIFAKTNIFQGKWHDFRLTIYDDMVYKRFFQFVIAYFMWPKEMHPTIADGFRVSRSNGVTICSYCYVLIIMKWFEQLTHVFIEWNVENV